MLTQASPPDLNYNLIILSCLALPDLIDCLICTRTSMSIALLLQIIEGWDRCGMVDQSIEVRHYSRAVRLHKQSLESLLRYKCEKNIYIFLTYLPTLWTNKRPAFPSHITIQNVKFMPEWSTLQEQILKNSDIMGKKGRTLNSRFFLVIIQNYRVQGRKY